MLTHSHASAIQAVDPLTDPLLALPCCHCSLLATELSAAFASLAPVRVLWNLNTKVGQLVSRLVVATKSLLQQEQEHQSDHVTRLTCHGSN
jgi:hypothetical protein